MSNKKKLLIVIGAVIIVGVIIALNVLPKKEGQEVEVCILHIDADHQRLGLSLHPTYEE